MFLLSFIMTFNQWKSTIYQWSWTKIQEAGKKYETKVVGNGSSYCFVSYDEFIFAWSVKKRKRAPKPLLGCQNWTSTGWCQNLMLRGHSQQGGPGHIYYIKNQKTRCSWLVVDSGTLTQVPWFWNLDSGTLTQVPWFWNLDSGTLTQLSWLSYLDSGTLTQEHLLRYLDSGTLTQIPWLRYLHSGIFTQVP